MRHWSVDVRRLKNDPDALAVWELENAVNFGIRDGKIKRQDLLEYWDMLDLDPYKKKFLSLILSL
ncbi:hypothetical protein A2935_04080 [Candidatus Wolfebacteria bacterium RIFCSPLOWO2_01_FULL_47_17b]|uniref:Uncharacterized protein n=1 Tax=Candidatus Wolfebacteria bacterium RIFCSPLOWO2_01_FULL_47_17b TaxID=1802558 RepID=A0A1F8DZ78_9BACT|nr:MAG: hypothetical protein A2935_04080 [Candidatus Wolfebacteria bacterium RIFCSPLOWO2_01_FULL_47_17b]